MNLYQNWTCRTREGYAGHLHDMLGIKFGRDKEVYIGLVVTNNEINGEGVFRIGFSASVP